MPNDLDQYQEKNYINNVSIAMSYVELFMQKRKVAWVVFLFLEALTIIYLIVATPIYTSKTTILPPEGESSPIGVSSLLREFGGLNQPAKLNSAILYRSFLTSRTLITRIFTKTFFNPKTNKQTHLFEIFDIEGTTQERESLAYKFISENLMNIFYDGETGITTLEVESYDPKLSAEIAKALVEELDLFNRQYVTKKAGENRIFISSRIMETKQLLIEAEETLKHFREGNKRIENSPELQLEVGRLLREVRIQEEVFLTLKKEIEIAKIDEVKNLPLIRVLDDPVAPIEKSRPARKKILFLSTILSIMIAIASTFIANFISEIQLNQNLSQRIKKVVRTFKDDFRNLFQKDVNDESV